MVTLEPLRDSDSDTLFGWINDRDLVVRSSAFRPVARADHDRWFDEIRQRPDVRIFGIREDGRIVGSCQLLNISSSHRSAELQIRIGEPDARGRGIGRAAVRQLLELAFGELRLHRVMLHVFASNQPARRLYRAVGFREEGVLREAALVEGRYLDVVVMSILEGEMTDG